MKAILGLFMTIIIVSIIGCAGSSEPTTYTHENARFTVTCPAGWSYISQDPEMFEFRKGDVKLIEIGGFEFGEADFLLEMSDAEFAGFMRDASLDGLEGYCDEAAISDWTIDEQYHTTWGSLEAYRIRAHGYSDAAEVDMILDLIAAINFENGMLYMFASQIAKDQYEKTEAEIEAMIKSFRVN
jgi:hypothetical protein